MAKKNLNIGMVGYGFMGRAHSNAWRRVSNFFDTGYQPVLKAVAARDEAKAKAFADKWGYESVETDWRKLVARKDIDAIDICVPNNLHAEIAIAAAKAGKMILCEKPLARDAKEALQMVRGGREGGRRQHRLVQLPPHPGRHPRQADRRSREARKDLPLPRQLPAGLDDQSGRAAGRRGHLAARREGRRLRRHRRPARPLHRHGDLAQRLDQPRLRHDRNLREERKHAVSGKVEKVGIDDAAAVLARYRQRLARHLRIDPLRPRPQGALHAGDQRRARLLHVGPARPEPPAMVRPFGARGGCAAGPTSTSPTASTPISANGGCPASSSATSTPSCTRSADFSKA